MAVTVEKQVLYKAININMYHGFPNSDKNGAKWVYNFTLLKKTKKLTFGL